MKQSSPNISRQFRRPLGLMLVVSLLAISCVGLFSYQWQQRHFIKAAHKQLSSVADLKVNDITSWLKDQIENANFYRKAPVITAQVPLFLANPEAAEPRYQIRSWMARLYQRYHYDRVVLIDTQKQVRLSFPEDQLWLGPGGRNLVEAALRKNQTVISDLHTIPGSNAIHIDLIIPIPQTRKPDDFTSKALSDAALTNDLERLQWQPPVAVLLLQINPQEYLYPLVRRWPTMTKGESAETLLVRREGDEVVYLNELLHQTNTALRLRIPLLRTNVPAAQAVQGYEGVLEGIDYRGVPVLAATRKIAGSAWYLVAKVDRDEIYAPLRADAYRTVIVAVCLMLIATLGIGLFWYQREREFNLHERQEKMAALSHMAANVAHEVRNPLTAIKARLFTLTKGLRPGSPEQQDATVIGKEIDRIERIVKDYLRFARPAEPRLVGLKAGEALTEVCELLAPQLRQSQISLVVQPSEPATIQADPEQLKQVLINLVQNAADAIGQGGTITLRSRKSMSSLNGSGRPAVILEVSDTGPGISPEAQAHLFEPFYSTKPGGSGLGLSIATRIVEKHGGVLHYQTKTNQGTTFSIVLPEAETETI